jgi:hypothetical protein
MDIMIHLFYIMLDLNFNEPIQDQQAIFNSFRLDKFERKI